MRAMVRLSLWAAISFAAIGCTGSSTDSAVATTGGPDDAVFEFLEGVRVGDRQKTESLLTPVAREEIKKFNEAHPESAIEVAPPGSETASFEVGEVESVDEWVAHVSATWSDVNEQGETASDTIVWILRREDEGWRIGGMGTKLFEGEPPLFLNFENPEDMLRKQQLAEQEIHRRAMASENGVTPDSAPLDENSAPSGRRPDSPVLQAQQPAGPDAATRK